MKNKTLKFLSIGMVGVAAMSVMAQPVLATNDIDAVPQVEDSTNLNSENNNSSEEGSSEVKDGSSESSSEQAPTVVPGNDNSSEENNDSSDVAPTLSPSTIVIEAYNSDAGKYMDDINFEVKDSSGNVISFSKTSSGRYEVSSSGDKYVTTYNGSVEIKGLNGSYTVRNISPDGDVKCNTGEQSFYISPEERRSFTFEYSANYGTLRVTFTGEDETAIPNAVFRIKNSNGSIVYFAESGGVYEYNSNSSMSEITTNSMGMAVLHLPGGSYTIEQISAPVEYNGDMVTKNVTVNNQSDVGVTLVNQKKYGTLSVSITDSNDSSVLLSGATFTITTANGDNVYITSSGNGKYVFSRTSGDNVLTASNGKIEISNLPEGAYTITQKTGAVGYEMSAAKQFDVKADKTTSIAFRNERSVGTIKITVNDEETGKPIEGFRYKVLAEDKETVLKFRMSAKGYIYDENGSEEIESDENGEIIIEKVPVGTYFLKQSQAAEGYLLDVDEAEHEVQAGKEGVYNVKAVKSNSTIVIIDADGNAVAGVGFELVDANGDKVLEDVTDEDGKFIISNLDEGEYKLVVTTVPETFAQYKKEMKFTLDNKGQASGLGRITLEFNKATVNLGKEGIEVVLTNNADSSTITVKTDSKGIATFQKLSYGDYEITLADENIAFSPIKFTVDEEFSTVAYNVDLVETAPEDSEMTTSSNEDGIMPIEEPVVNKKANSGVIMSIIAVLVGIAGGVGYYMFRKKKSAQTLEETSDDSIKVGYDEDGNAVLYSEVEVDIDEDEDVDISEMDAESETELEELEELDELEELEELDSEEVQSVEDLDEADAEEAESASEADVEDVDAENTEDVIDTAETVDEAEPETEDFEAVESDEKEDIYGLSESESDSIDVEEKEV